MKEFAKVFELPNGQQVLFELVMIDVLGGTRVSIKSSVWLDSTYVEIHDRKDIDEETIAVFEGFGMMTAMRFYNYVYEQYCENEEELINHYEEQSYETDKQQREGIEAKSE